MPWLISRAVNINRMTSITGSNSYPCIPMNPRPQTVDNRPVMSGAHQVLRPLKKTYRIRIMMPSEMKKMVTSTGR